MNTDRLNSARHWLVFFLASGILALSFLFLPIQVARAAPKSNVTVTVDTTTDDNGAGFQVCSGVAGDCSLRGAITKANTDITNTYTIIVPAGIYTHDCWN